MKFRKLWRYTRQIKHCLPNMSTLRKKCNNIKIIRFCWSRLSRANMKKWVSNRSNWLIWNLRRINLSKLENLNCRSLKCRKVRAIWSRKYVKIVLPTTRSSKSANSSFQSLRGKLNDLKINWRIRKLMKLRTQKICQICRKSWMVRCRRTRNMRKR